ncbi:hypothetical protein BGZ99_006461 [Dissophora globulifera]|uniref:Uncharacterized protein n=1 Tax=Dissophora globulifera TaxID=979702 RepID=A0A9P6UR41_9FUNG|nr:hypothetical protein BGZ99_006461 [Dissophora globulifera]
MAFDIASGTMSWGLSVRMATLRPSAGDFCLLHGFKLQLDETIQQTPLDNGISALEAFTHYLKELHEFAMLESLRGSLKNCEPSHIQYVLTVPARWSDAAKNKMRGAAINAGLIKEDDPPSRLNLIVEPEAAALYCERNCERFDLNHGDQFLVCEAGNEAVDLTVFEIAVTAAGRRLSKVTNGHGASCGSDVLDRHMQRFLEEIFGCIAANFPANIIPKLVDTFAHDIKSQFDGLEDQFLRLPAHRCFDDLEDPEAFGIDDGYLFLTAAELKENVFEPVTKDVLSLIQEQLTQTEDCAAIFLVGDFTSFNYLYSRVKQQFSSQISQISIPPRPDLAVVHGAVCAGLNLYFGHHKLPLLVTHMLYYHPELPNSANPNLPKLSRNSGDAFNLSEEELIARQVAILQAQHQLDIEKLMIEHHLQLRKLKG